MDVLDRDGDGWLSAGENPLTGMNAPSLEDMIPFPENTGSRSSIDAKDFDYNSLDEWKKELYRRFKEGDDSAGEKLFNYIADEFNNKTALDFSKNQYQYLMEDLKKAGISPYILSSAAPNVPSLSASGGSQMTSRLTSKYSSDQNASQNDKDRQSERVNRLILSLGLVLGAIIRAAM